MSNISNNNIALEQAETIALLEEAIKYRVGRDFKLKDVESFRNVFINCSYLNEYIVDPDGPNYFSFGQHTMFGPEALDSLRGYMYEVIKRDFNIEHSMYIAHHNGFLVIDTNSLRHTETLDIWCEPDFVGQLVGKKANGIKRLIQKINEQLSQAGSKLKVSKINVLKIKIK